MAQLEAHAKESKQELKDSIDMTKVESKEEVEVEECEEDKLVMKKADSLVKAKREMESKVEELSDSDDDLQQIIKKKEKPVSVPDQPKADTIMIV